MDSADDVPSEKKTRSTCDKIVETGFLAATWMALGIYLEIFGPTLIDLKLKLNANYEEVAVSVSGRSVGLFPGCVIGGLLVDKFGKYCHLMLAVSLDVAAIVTLAVPWSPNVEVLWFLCFVGGLLESIINIAGQRLVLKLWQEKAATPMILLHSGYGIGSFFIPLYTNPFLAEKKPDNETMTNLGSDSNLSLITTPLSVLSTTEPEYITESRIEYSYAISAALVALHSLTFYFYQLRERRYFKNTNDGTRNDTNAKSLSETSSDEKRTFLKIINPATCSGGRFSYGIQLFVLIFLYFANVGGGERVVAGFLRSFSIDQLDFSNDDASYINSVYWISCTVGRLSFSAAARWIPIRSLILIETGGLLTVSVLLNFFARSNSTAYWILLQALGIFDSPLWPSGVAWADYHLDLTGMGMMLFLLGGSVGGICHLRIIGYLYEHVGAYTFLYQVLGYGVLVFILAIVLDLAGSQHGSRFNWTKNNVQNETTSVESKDMDNQTENLETRNI